jgi:hypothetical protein
LRAWKTITVLTLSCLGSGCLRSGGAYNVQVDNVADTEIRDVQIEYKDGPTFSAQRIGPSQEKVVASTSEKIPQEVIIRWKDSGGEDVVRQLKTKDRFPKEFRGSLVFQIGVINKLRIHLTSDRSTDSREIPWNYTDGIDGAVNVPGFDGN